MRRRPRGVLGKDRDRAGRKRGRARQHNRGFTVRRILAVGKLAAAHREEVLVPITKEIFLNTLFCPRFGWGFAHKKREVKAGLGERLRLMVGSEIGTMAREASGPGELIGEGSIEEALKHTKRALRSSVTTIYEGAFVHGPFVARADILKRRKGKWDLFEVKSSMNPRPELVDDLAYTAAVAKEAGLEIGGAYLTLISKEYRYGDRPSAAFVNWDATQAVEGRVADFAKAMPTVARVFEAQVPPKVEMVWNCRQCPDRDLCLGAEFPVFDLPRLSEAKFKDLLSKGIHGVKDVPDDFKDSGSILTYGSFEKTVLRNLAEWFPNHKAALEGMVERIVDLEKIIEKHYCHPALHGSWSIKRTLPVLVPDLSYDGLAIREGDTASAAFQLMARGDIPESEHPQYRERLLRYCELDTLAMVKLHQALVALT